MSLPTQNGTVIWTGSQHGTDNRVTVGAASYTDYSGARRFLSPRPDAHQHPQVTHYCLEDLR